MGTGERPSISVSAWSGSGRAGALGREAFRGEAAALPESGFVSAPCGFPEQPGAGTRFPAIAASGRAETRSPAPRLAKG